MATQAMVKDAVKNGGNLVPQDRLETMLGRIDIKKRFEEILGKKAPGFVSSILSVANSSQHLKGADPRTILGSAVIAATLDLPINPNLGFAYIVPYKGIAQFQMGYKGFIQLAIRSGQYKTIHAAEVYEDEIRWWNALTGDFAMKPSEEWKQRETGQTDKIVGYVAFFRLINGFEKYLYMTKAQVERHAKKYSQSYSGANSKSSRWAQDFDVMALKTLLKLLLSKYGILSIEMQKAIQADQGSTTETDPDKQVFDHPDVQDAEIRTGEDQEAEKFEAMPPKPTGPDIDFPAEPRL